MYLYKVQHIDVPLKFKLEWKTLSKCYFRYWQQFKWLNLHIYHVLSEVMDMRYPLVWCCQVVIQKPWFRTILGALWGVQLSLHITDHYCIFTKRLHFTFHSFLLESRFASPIASFLHPFLTIFLYSWTCSFPRHKWNVCH